MKNVVLVFLLAGFTHAQKDGISAVAGAPAAPRIAAAGALARMAQVFEPALERRGFVTRDGVRVSANELSMGPHWMRLVGADLRARGAGEESVAGKSHYFIGNDPRSWRTNVPNYARVRYRNVYPGIDVVYYGSGRDIEFDFVLAPGADPGRIQLAMSSPDLKLHEPRILQGGRIVQGRAVRKHNRVTFELAAYDRSHPLTIDPVIGFAMLTGGPAGDSGTAIAVDRSGATYVTGSTNANALGFPVSPHVFVTKLGADGSTVLYNAVLDGGDVPATSFGNAIAVDAAGNAYFAGLTTSPTFPLVNPAQSTFGGRNDAFVAKLSPDASTLLYSTYLGGNGSDLASGIALDSAGNAHVTGTTSSDNFPTLNAFQPKRGGSSDGFVTKLSPAGALVFSTYFGGKADDGGQAIAVDSKGSIFVTGYTWSTDFPVMNAFAQFNPGGGDAFIAKLTADGSSLVWSTFLGGTGYDVGNAIAVDASSNVFVAGTTSSRDFPTVNALQAGSASAVLRKSVDGAATFAGSDAGLPGAPAALAIDPSNSSNVYAAVLGNVYKSTDGGRTWSKSLDDPAITFITQIAIDPSSPSNVYAGSQGVVSKTTDGGATWKSVKYGGATVQTLAVNPKNSAIYAGSGGGQDSDGLYYSSDSGETWRRPSLGGPAKAIKAFAFDPANPATLYANSGNALYKSTDGGGSFIPLKPPFNPAVLPGAILVDPSNSAIIYAVGSPPNAAAVNIFKSNDGGQSWLNTGFSAMALAIDPSNPATLYAATSAGLNKTTDGFAHAQVVNGSANISLLAVSPSAPGTLYAVTFGITRDAFVARLSADGQLYLYCTYLGGGGDDSASSIALDASGNVHVAGSTGSGDFPTKNGFAQHSVSNDGFVAKLAGDGSAVVYSSYVGAPVTGLAVDSGSAAYLTGAWTRTDFFSNPPRLQYIADSVFRSDDAGASFAGSVFPGGAIGAVAPDPHVPNRVFAAGSVGVFRSLDAGRNWTLSTRGDGFLVVPGLVHHPVNTGTLWYSYAGGVQKTTDGGDHWHATPGLTNGGGPSIVIDPRNPSILYVSTFLGMVNPQVPSIFKSTDGGETWAPLPSSPFVPSTPASLTRLTVDAQSNLYATINFVLFKSSDGGVNFNRIQSAPAFATLLTVDSATPSTLYVTTLSGGLHRSTDAGVTFSKILQAAAIPAFAIDPASPGTLYAALDTGIAKSRDGGATWMPTGLLFPYVNTIAVDAITPGRVYAGTAVDPSDVFVIKVVE